MIWNKLKKAFGFEDADSENFDGGTSIQRLVNQNYLNKRKNIRIHYPHLGATGLYPHILYHGHELNVGNISLGGLLIIDDTEQFGSQVGEIVNLDFTWPDLSTKLRARIVGANLQKRHLQFVDFNPQAFLKISLLVKSGHLGQRFHRVRNDSGTLQADEMWLGPTGETLVFPPGAKRAELSYAKENVTIQKGAPTRSGAALRPAPVSQLHDVLIMFANFPGLTPRIKELVEILDLEIRNLSTHRTGTHG
jgi:hypothetical protein